MIDLEVNRRRFLRGGGGLLLGTLIFTSGPIALLAPSQSWALEMNALSSGLGAKLLVLIRRIYPHDNMEDAVYALVVKALDDQAAKDPSILPLLKEGFNQLDQQSASSWLDLAETDQVRSLESIQDGDFFKLVRGAAVNTLYSNELAYKHFGYEGASFPKGGYLMRGFNDLQWLPSPPADASPAAFS